MPSTESAHFVITVDVKRVTKSQPVTNYSGTRTQVDAEPIRVVDDVTHVVMKAATLEAAVEKATAVLQLEVPTKVVDDGSVAIKTQLQP